MNNDQTQLLSKITDLSEDQKLELFSVEELENRLEMAAAAEALIDATANGVCWIG
ncbi:hypothetical protein [Hymenobacter cellulosivorans]|uniref:Uncharacterized protein n=1 Tax=Hymenobacter cellulosivorans TaxID=2932249 RepID=A0ABY4FCK6_9BACT|nr:hypothetical protein [Hymenobacter cellulosivorans]UOQ53763.1 hypothetical protein MUN80_03145 [Hymenobacter cellulosivorans]